MSLPALSLADDHDIATTLLRRNMHDERPLVRWSALEHWNTGGRYHVDARTGVGRPIKTH